MEMLNNEESPLVLKIGFGKLIDQYRLLSQSSNSLVATRAGQILETIAPYPMLYDGFENLEVLLERKNEIDLILTDAFSPVLAQNEIKTAGIPFSNVLFKTSERFDNILSSAGTGFEPTIRNMPDNLLYIMQCSVILVRHFGFEMDFKRPLYYDIPDKNGVMHHYRIMYNADFMEITPNEKAIALNHKDFEELLENFDDIDLWKRKIPPGSYDGKGFVISNIFDVTAEYAISEIKSGLIGNLMDDSDYSDFEFTFRSLFNLPNIKVGFTGYDPDQGQFFKIHGKKGLESYLLGGLEDLPMSGLNCPKARGCLMNQQEFFAIPDLEKYYHLSNKAEPYKSLYEQGFRSAILAPIATNGVLVSTMDLVSYKKNELNSVNATKLIDVMPFITSAVLNSIEEEQNQIDAIIQHECTTVHDSVRWKFKQEAKNFLTEQLKGNNPVFNEISFKDVVPLYGQVDIVDSSNARNTAIQRDLIIQLSEISVIISKALEHNNLPIYEEILFRVKGHLEEIAEVLYTHSEQTIFEFIQEEVNPVLHHLKTQEQSLKEWVTNYESKIDEQTGSYYDHRKNYDQSVTKINLKLASLLDKRQQEAQQMFPHYFERYKTDGVEHNLYIGQSISKDKPYNELFLNNLRLWQLQVMVEMENEYYQFKNQLKVPLDVASLLLVYSTPIAIRFRMDEKRFDVDGTYNARYEIIKKRIDKSFIKGTNERLTQKGKIAIVYSQKNDEREYLRYVQFLKSKNYFTSKIEIVELDGLQGVTGLKAIRAEILYKAANDKKVHYTYADLMATLAI